MQKANKSFHPWKKFINLGIRGFTVVSRFGLVLAVSKLLPTSHLGDFSLFNTSILLGYMILGWDFYMYSTRKLIGVRHALKAIYFTYQLYFYLGFYIISFPILLLISKWIGLPFSYTNYFFTLLVFEHLGQEIFRLLVAVKKPIYANLSFFIRNSSWIIVLFVFFVLGEKNIWTLRNIYLFWLIASVVNFLIFSFYIVFILKLVVPVKPNLRWIFSGFKIASYYFISTIAFKIVEFGNRYVLDWKASKADVGVYSLYSQIAGLINVFVFTFTIMYLYPQLVEAQKSQNWNELVNVKKSMIWQIITISIALSLLIVIFIDPVLSIINKPEISSNKPVLYVLLIANIFLSLSFVWNYILFAFEKDKKLMIINVSAAVLVLVLSFIFISLGGVMGASVALLSGFLFLLIAKIYAASHINKEL